LSSYKERFSKQAFYGARWAGYDDQPQEVRRETMVMNIAAAFPGWTLEYIREMDPMQQAAIIGNMDGRRRLDQWIEHKKNQARKRAQKRPKRR